VIGQELAVDAVTSWQPALCSGGGPLFSYTQLTDDVARSQVPSGPLAIVTDPIPPDQVAADHPLVYAPMGLSALAIAFNINYQPDAEHQSAGDLALNGRRFTSMKLTPRLVAKLLTQSYRFALLDQPPEMKNNPTGLLADPEFLNLNPEYQGFVDRGLTVPDPLVQINGADITSLLWRWITADPDARAFLAGSPDPFGMVINPNNKNLVLPTSTFPRNDQSCATTTDDFGNSLTNCNLDLHPYATDMHNAGRSASRGDSQARQNIFDNTVHQPVSTKFPRQLIGARALMAVVDAATAARYDLPTAQLLNAAGKYVAPTTDSLLAGEKAMKPSAVAGVLTPDPAASDPAAYPLTSLSYAVTSPTMLDAAASKDYAAFLRYAGGPGQRPGVGPGQLPPGMVPLPDPLKAQTIAAAATLEKATSTALPSPPQPTVTGTATGADGHPTASPPRAIGTQAGATNTGGAQTPVTPPDVTGSGSRPPATTPRVAQQPLARVGRTPSLPTPVVGAVLGAILAGGLVLAISSPAVRLLGVVIQRRQRKGVTPTER
jgi:hypothetical protein